MTEQVLDRQQKHRLAVLRHAEEISGNVAATCRYYGISRQMFYTWQRRYDAEGVDGLKARSRRPRTSPNATHAERWLARSSIYARTTTSGLARSRCTSSDTTTSTSPAPASGGSSSGSR